MTLTALALALSGCASSKTSDSAICTLTDSSRAELVAALLEDGGKRSLVAGEYLLRQLETACNPH